MERLTYNARRDDSERVILGELFFRQFLRVIQFQPTHIMHQAVQGAARESKATHAGLSNKS